LWSTHLVDELKHVDRLIILDRGKVVYDGLIPELLALHKSDDLETTLLEIMAGREKAPAEAPLGQI